MNAVLEKTSSVATGLAESGENSWGDRLQAELGPQSVVRWNEPLHRRTTLRVGGAAEVYFEPSDEETLQKALRFCAANRIPVFILGRGSNLLIRDGGIPGLVVSLQSLFFSSIEILDRSRMRVGAGAKLKDVAHTARRQGWAGLEFFEGIPGSMGGALRMNAGAMGSWTFGVVESVRVMSLKGDVVEHDGPSLGAVYRECTFLRNHLALGATLCGRPEDAASVKERMDQYNSKRWESQPAQSSAGCTFKNPSVGPAGKILDDLGLKGFRIGQAMVSDVHANFIVNLGGATARDVLELIDEVKRRVRAARSIDLETEVEIVGVDSR